MEAKYKILERGVVLRAEDGRTIYIGKDYFDAKDNPQERDNYYIGKNAPSVKVVGEIFKEIYEEIIKRDSRGILFRIEKLEPLAKRMKNHLAVQGIDLDF